MKILLLLNIDTLFATPILLPLCCSTIRLVQDSKMPADHFQVKLSGNWKDIPNGQTEIMSHNAFTEIEPNPWIFHDFSNSFDALAELRRQ